MRRHSPLRINAVASLIGAALLLASGSWQLARQDWHVYTVLRDVTPYWYTTPLAQTTLAPASTVRRNSSAT